MARTPVPPQGPDWPPERTLRVLKQQLASLQTFKDKTFREVENEEIVWKQITEGAMMHGFGEDSHNAHHFFRARNAGVHNTMGVSEHQKQLNYNKRIERFEATLRSSIAELEASLPEAEVRGAYDAGDEYAFYRDLKEIIGKGKSDIFIVDNYLNTEVFDLYAAAVCQGVAFRMMTDQIKGTLGVVARKYAGSHRLELRTSQEVHDRHIFVDDRCWAVGQSIKDAAKKKPTYMVELSESLVQAMRDIYEGIWSNATVVVKS